MNKKRYLLIITIPVLLIILAILSLIIPFKPKNPVFAFYNVPEKQKNAVITILDNSLAGKYEIIDLEAGIPLSQQNENLKKASLVFTVNDADVRDFALTNKKVMPVSKDLTSGMPLSITSTLTEKGTGYSYLPFLYDMYEIDINYDLFQETSINNINKWDDLLSLATEERLFTNTPISFSAKDDTEFLNIFGQIFEVYSTYQKYDLLYSKLYQAFKLDNAGIFTTANCEQTLNELLENDTDFAICLNNIKAMLTNKQINSNTLNQGEDDTLFLCNKGLTGITFLKLSDHRKINRDIIGHYKSIFFPSLFTDDNRKFSANEYSLIMLKNNKTVEEIIKVITDTKQSELCKLSGLAPVQKNSQTPDKQADDVRYWLAASLGPLPPLSTAIPDYRSQQAVAEIIRSRLK